MCCLRMAFRMAFRFQDLPGQVIASPMSAEQKL